MRIIRYIREKGEKGFTLIEMVFVITIFAIMAAIVLFNFNGFGTATALDNLAQDIALKVVQAQKAATSGALTPGEDGLSEASAPSYGVHFQSGSAETTDDQSFTYFADQNHDGFLSDISGSPCPTSPIVGIECLSVSTITTGDYVSQICALHSVAGGPDQADCRPDASLDVTFTRPYNDAVMKVCPVSGPCSAPIVPDAAYIEITSTLNPSLKQTIVVTALGEVRVAQGDACTVANGPGVPCGPF